MTNFSFNPEVEKLDVLYEFNGLSDTEFEIVNSIVKWDVPNRFKDRVFSAAGRSVFIESPDKVESESNNILGSFSGIQIIGAGGNLSYVQAGVQISSKEIEIQQVSEKNAVDKIPEIFQTRDISLEGKLILGSKKYVPLMGMDKNEASLRREMTNEFREMSKMRNGTQRPPFVTPEIVLEGRYTSLFDTNGDPLKFQAYRVPKLPRFGNQFIQVLRTGNHDTINDFLEKFSYLHAASLKTVNMNGYAYVQPHPDNFSYIRDEKKHIIYMTDLGTLKDVSCSPFQEKEMALDVFIVGQSYLKFFESVFCNDEFDGKNAAMYYFQKAFLSFFQTYYKPEIKSNRMNMPEASELLEHTMMSVLCNKYEKYIERF